MMRFFVSCDELAALTTEQSVRVLDMRWPVGNGPDGIDQYLRGRISGAAHLGFDAVRAPDPLTEGRAVGPDALAATLAGLGVDDATTVIAYDDNHQFTAARLVWLMRAYGFERAFRLDGGWPAWLRSGAPVETGPPRRSFPAAPPPTLKPTIPAIATLDDVRAHQMAGLPIADCRRDTSWEEDPCLVAGATRLPMRLLVDPSGLHLPPSRIRAVAAVAGISPDVPAIAYCGAAISAAAVWLALRSAGITNVRVYDGSITDL